MQSSCTPYTSVGRRSVSGASPPTSLCTPYAVSMQVVWHPAMHPACTCRLALVCFMHARPVHALACMMHASRFGVAQSWPWRCGAVAQVPRLWRCGVKHGFVELPQILAQQDFLVDSGFHLPSIGLVCIGGSGSSSRSVSRTGVGPADYVAFWRVRLVYPLSSCGQ